MNNSRFLILLAGMLALLLSIVESREPVRSECDGTNSAVIVCDDFERGDFEQHWDIGANRKVWPTSQFVLCSEKEFGFHDGCAAWSNLLAWDTEWGHYGYDARRSFAPQPEFYVRWYQFISDPFVWGTLEDKSVMLHDQDHTITAYVGTSRDARPSERNSGPGVPFIANYQDLDWPETGNQFEKVNRFQNQRPRMLLHPGRWYLFEWYVRLNTPGVSNGVTRLWIDEAALPIATQTLRLEYSDMRWRKATDADKQFGEVRLTVYHQRCDDPKHNTCPPHGPSVLEQSQRWDHLVVSRRKIGALTQ